MPPERQDEEDKLDTDQAAAGAKAAAGEEYVSAQKDQDDKLDTDQAAAGAKAAADEEYVSEQKSPDEKIGTGQLTAGAGRRPPKKYRWSKGQSGNPSGRPRKQLDQKATFERIMNEAVVIRSQDGKERKVPKYGALIRSLFSKALKGDVRAAKFIMDEAVRLGIGEQQGGGFAGLPRPDVQAPQSDFVFNDVDLDLDLLSDDEKIELARLGKAMDLGGDFTALSVAEFARMKQIADKGRGKDVTPRA